MSQRAAWLVIGLAPICLILFALVQHCMLVAKRKAAEALETRLQGIRLDLLKGEQDQKCIEQAAEYLGRSDPKMRSTLFRRGSPPPSRQLSSTSNATRAAI